MKAKKLTKAAVLLLTASIAVMASACTVEFSDQNGTVDKVIEAVADKNIDVKVDSSDPASQDKSVQKADPAPESSDKRNDVEETSQGEVEISDKKDVVDETDATTEADKIEESTIATQKPLAMEDCCLEFVEDYDDRTYNLDCAAGSFSVKAGKTTIIITYNGKEFSLPITWDNIEVYPYGPVFVHSNGNSYLYIGTSLECGKGFHHNVNVYKIENDNVSYVGSLEGISHQNYTMTDPNSFICFEDEAEELGISVLREYKVGEDGMPVPVSDIRDFHDVCHAVSFSEDWTGFVISGGEVSITSKTIKSGDFVRLIQTDGSMYLDVLDKDGDLIRLDWTNIFNQYDKNDTFYYAHAIHDNAKEEIPCYEF